MLYYVLEEYIEKYCGVFDDGYDVYCEWVFVCMIDKGILLEGMVLILFNLLLEEVVNLVDYVCFWGEFFVDERWLFVCFVEVFVGFLEYIDV